MRIPIWRGFVETRDQFVFRFVCAHADVVIACIAQNARSEFVTGQSLHLVRQGYRILAVCERRGVAAFNTVNCHIHRQIVAIH